MAELASGAVSSLLGVLRNEAQLLGRVRNDVEFIKEEMESMNSFLEHLARTAPPVGGHDEQVQTWMRQVRDLAHACSNCIDLYLQRGDPAVYRARGGRWRYLWWAKWLVHQFIAQHKAAIRLRELKERARDVGERRFRYGVEIPGRTTKGPAGPEAAASSSSQSAAAALDAAEDEDVEDDGQNQTAMMLADSSDTRRRALLQPRSLEKYCTDRLIKWLSLQPKADEADGLPLPMPSIAIVAPDTEDANAIAREALAMAPTHFDKIVRISLLEVHFSWDLPLIPREILSYILLQCEKGQGGNNPQSRRSHYNFKLEIRDEIWTKIDGLQVNNKIDQIRTEIGQVEKEIMEQENKTEDEETKSLKSSANILSHEPLGILHQALRRLTARTGPDVSNKSSWDEITMDTAEMLKLHMHNESNKAEDNIVLDNVQYVNILQKVFPASGNKQAQEGSPKTTLGLGEDQQQQAKEITHNHKITLEIIRELPSNTQGQMPGPEPEDRDTSATAGNTQAAKGGTTTIQAQAAEAEHNSSSSAAADKDKDKQTKLPSETNKTRLLIKGTLDKITLDTLREQEQLGGRNSSTTSKKQDAWKIDAISAAINETKEKMYKIRWKIKVQLLIKGTVDRINKCLKDKKTLIVLQDERGYISKWGKTRNALSLLRCPTGSAIAVVKTNSQRAREFCFPPTEPITYSVVGFYHDISLQLTRQLKSEDGATTGNAQILHDILNSCDLHEFSMKMFAHALFANPRRSNEELKRLLDALQDSDKSLPTSTKMFRFTYRDLPREHKTCLLYLAIFPQGHKFGRSALVGRWLAEGLITKEDRPTAVRHAERCFDALIDRCLVLPCDIGATGKVKSCMVGDLIHGCITKIAKKEHILDARLSDLWAHHFSIFSGIRLRASEGITKFVYNLPKYSPQLPLLKVLDLEGCKCFERKNRRYLRDICNKILLLKYLSLRRTDIDHLPIEINNLHELEVLDIRQTQVPECATRVVLLLKLKRLLAGGHNNPCPAMAGSGTESPSSAVQIPSRIRKMENMEVLSNIKASEDGGELKDIKNLWQLRKLGVVIKDKQSHVSNLLGAIGDLEECLQSLSITISNTSSSSPCNEKKQQNGKDNYSSQKSPKLLGSLSISGATHWVQILNFFAKGSKELAKITLSSTRFNNVDDLKDLSMLPKLRCIRFQNIAYNDRQLTFSKDEFLRLKYFLVQGTSMSDIKFEDGAVAELEKMILSFTDIRSLCGIGSLPKLMELELRNNKFLLSFCQDGADHEPKTEIRDDKKNNDTGTGDLEKHTKSGFNFKKDEFQHLEHFLVEDSKMTTINFEVGSAPRLEKITLSLSNKESQLTGVTYLSKLKKIELKGDVFLLKSFDNVTQIAMVTLRDTRLKQVDIETLSHNKPNLRHLELLDESYTESQLNFSRSEFPKLTHLIVDCSSIQSIGFSSGSARNLEKMVWSTPKMESLSGIGILPRLKEVELNTDLVPHQVWKDIAAHQGQAVLKHKMPRQQD